MGKADCLELGLGPMLRSLPEILLQTEAQQGTSLNKVAIGRRGGVGWMIYV